MLGYNNNTKYNGCKYYFSRPILTKVESNKNQNALLVKRNLTNEHMF